MNAPRRQTILLFLAAAVFLGQAARAQNLGQIGVTLLRVETTNLNGSGIRIAQVEANNGDTNGIFHGTNSWEVNPAAVGQPLALFTYTSGLGTSTSFTNGVGDESGHADAVARNFYGIPSGVATNVAHVDNFEANYFINSVIEPTPYLPPDIGDAMVNQSFTFGPLSTNDQETVDSAYDNYADTYQTLFISAACNASISPRVCAPGTAYNCISVGAYGGDSSVGPTLDNGRCKPDIVAPGGATSFSTPYVAGAAALLMQAALRGDGGNTNSAVDIRTVKALLLNGAIKPAGWTNSNSSPLDARYGAGVLNVFNSYEQLAGGKQGYIVSAAVSSGGAHPPTGDSGTVGVLNGWDFNSISSTSGGILSSATDGVNHYYFNVTNGSGSAAFTLTATLVWNRQQNQTGINNLDLFLYDCANSNLVACSTSRVDNVEHIFLPKLAQGRYDLQILKSAGNSVSDAETYALAFEFFSEPLQIAQVETNAAFSWPVYPAGFTLESATNLASPAVWTTNNIPPLVVTNSQNYILLNATNANRFFRLRRP